MRAAESGEQILILATTDRSCGYGGATLVSKRGSEDGDVWLAAYLKSMGHATYTIQHELVWKVVEQLAYSEITVMDEVDQTRDTLVKLSGVIRALRAELQDKFKMAVAQHPVLRNWFVRHSA